MNSEKASSLFISAIVMIPRDHSFDQFAARLSQIAGASFTEEMTGRYDELPVYEAKLGELDFLLIGPEGEDDDEYRLEFTCTTSTPIEMLVSQSNEFTRLFIHPKAANSLGYLDFSKELAEALVSLGIPSCRPVTLGN